MRMFVDQNYIALKFRYDARIVSAVRSLPGRQFDSLKKLWLVPIEHAEETIRLLGPYGFEVPMNLIELMTKWEKEKATLAEIKKGGYPTYVGNLPLYKFQTVGVGFIQAAQTTLLADQPGLGKTIQTIGALYDEQRIIVFCPASLKYNWQEEIAKWTNEDVIVINGTPGQRKRLWLTDAKWYIANYELLLKDFYWIKQRALGAACVCDEAQRISNPDAKSVRALKLLPFKKKLALTGTPISNSPVDVWSIVDWLRPGYLGTFTQFKDKHCVTNQWNDVIAYKNLGSLASQLEPLMLRRTKDEVLTDFPAKTVQDVKFDMSEGEIKLYQIIIAQIQEELKKLSMDPRYLGDLRVKMLRLQQVADSPELVGSAESSTKFETLSGLVREIVESGEKVIIFTRFAKMAAIIHRTFNSALKIDGQTPQADRQVIVNKFRDDPNYKIIIMTEAGSAGLNLQAASYVIHYDLPWSVAKLEQREGRAHRIGQTKPVTVYNLIAKNTMDEYVAKVLHKKNRISVDVLQDVDRLEAAGLDIEDIKAILRL